MLNPTGECFCLDATKSTIELPIRINQTMPILIELERFDIETGENETITITAKEAKKLKKHADKAFSKKDTASPRVLSFPVKRTGLYKLKKVVDESKLEVRRKPNQALVVTCPKASVKSTSSDKCKGDLSNIVMEVEGMPPLKIKYSTVVNREDRGTVFQSIQPENLVSPFSAGSKFTGAMVWDGDVNVQWARSQVIQVPLNESLSKTGGWRYTINEIHDACGNVGNFTTDGDEDYSAKGAKLDQHFDVHERPKVHLLGCDPQRPLKVAKGTGVTFPLEWKQNGQSDGPYVISYLFTPADKILANGEHAPDAKVLELHLKNTANAPMVREPGLYTLTSMSSHFCDGEVMEPASCILLNPPEPELAISAEPVYDKCAGNSIALDVDLNLVGTPPFNIRYEIQQSGSSQVRTESVRVDKHRHQIQFKPHEAGHWTYRFKSLDDSVYKGVNLKRSDAYVVEHDVKPAASAKFVNAHERKRACIDEPVSVDIKLQGELPWSLSYELIHAGKRKKYTINDIQTEKYTITTDNLVNGGEYSLSLSSVQDKSKCKIFLNEEAKIDVRRQRPKAAFGQIEGQSKSLTLEGRAVKIPLRLTGEGPWTIKYQNLEDQSVNKVQLYNANDAIEVRQQGRYQILEVQDKICPGSVEKSSGVFAVEWIPRPEVQFSPSAFIDTVNGKHVKKEVCEGHEDAFEVTFSGKPPYTISYEQHFKPEHGVRSVVRKDVNSGVGVASIRMETSEAGQYTYVLSDLSDNHYDPLPGKEKHMVIEQLVNAKPRAVFAEPSDKKLYNLCKEDAANGETIPIRFEGLPPFFLELGIKHSTSNKPEIIRIPNIQSHTYDFSLPKKSLTLGRSTVSIRKVADGRNCQRKTEFDPAVVQVRVQDVPTITPLENKRDYCVGDRISFELAGSEPFTVFYTFEGQKKKALSTNTNFRRIAEKPGNFTVTGLQNADSDCTLHTHIEKIIHEMPSVRISHGKETSVDIHEGGETDLTFEFWGTPPFEFM
jgi:nucleoporin POM152